MRQGVTAGQSHRRPPIGFMKYLRVMKKAIAVLAILGILGIAIAALPEHFSASSSHDGCEICHFFNHPPTLQLGNITLANPIVLQGRIALVLAFAAVLDSKRESRPSRAPPSLY